MKNYDTIYLQFTTDDIVEGRVKLAPAITIKMLFTTKPPTSNEKFDFDQRTLNHVKHYLREVGFDTSFIKFDNRKDMDNIYTVFPIEELKRYYGNIRNLTITYGYRSVPTKRKKDAYKLSFSDSNSGGYLYERDCELILHNNKGLSEIYYFMSDDGDYEMLGYSYSYSNEKYQIVDLNRTKKYVKIIEYDVDPEDDFFKRKRINLYMRPNKIKKILQ